MRFSIVVPTYEYNGLAAKLLDELLNSIKYQTYNNYEIINNGKVSEIVNILINKPKYSKLIR